MSVDSRRGNREKLEEFIDLYRRLPCLWQIKSKDYHNRDLRNAAYQQLVDVLKEIDPDANKETVIKKINTYRTNYRKEYKKVENSKTSGAGTDEVYVPSLWYYDKLNFLQDQDTPRTSQSNLTGEESTTEETEIHNESLLQTEETEIHNESSSDVQSPQASTSSTSTIGLSQQLPARNRSRPTKRTSNSESLTEDVLQSVRDHFKRPAIQPQSEDGCDVFGKMVAIKLRELPREQRLFAEKIISDTLFEAQFGNLTISHKLTSSTLPNQIPQQQQRQILLEPRGYLNNRNINYNSHHNHPTYFQQANSHDATTMPQPQIPDTSLQVSDSVSTENMSMVTLFASFNGEN